MPVHAVYCSCDACRSDFETMPRILQTPSAELSDDDIDSLFMTAYWTGLNWPSLAYYAPEMLARLPHRSVVRAVAAGDRSATSHKFAPVYRRLPAEFQRRTSFLDRNVLRPGHGATAGESSGAGRFVIAGICREPADGLRGGHRNYCAGLGKGGRSGVRLGRCAGKSEGKPDEGISPPPVRTVSRRLPRRAFYRPGQ